MVVFGYGKFAWWRLKEEEGLYDVVMNSYVIWIDFVVAWKKQAIFKGLDSTIYVLRVEGI